MPELPEVTTTVRGINSVAKNLIIKDVWSDWPKLIKSGGFQNFKRDITGLKILGATRRAKNILIELSKGPSTSLDTTRDRSLGAGKTLLVHLKMTGHILYGKWRPARTTDGVQLGRPASPQGAGWEAKKENKPCWKWVPIDEDKKHPLNDPYNRFIHLIFFLSNGHQLVLSDTRKFAKVLLFNTNTLNEHPDLKTLGPEPLAEDTTLEIFSIGLNKKPNWPIKQALLNQELIAGIGNIYSDEILWTANIHPLTKVNKITPRKMRAIYTAMKNILEKSISLGGDSMSDYRNIHGARGGFQDAHMVYRKTGEKCGGRNCAGTIERIKIAGRSAHFCNKHQKLKNF